MDECRNQCQRRSFDYDGDGNRIAEHLQANDSVRYRMLANTDRMITRFHGYYGNADSVQYHYDWNGNVIWEEEKLNGIQVPQIRYYDAAGQLVLARRVVSAVIGGEVVTYATTVPYRYDGLGRRVSDNALATFHDGSNVVNTNGAEILHGPAIDDPLVVFAPPGQPLACGGITGPAAYAITTGTGRLLDFHDAGGYDCTPYHPWTDYAQYAGAIRDSYGVGLSRAADTTALNYFRNRYYDSRSGRFSQEDPIGFAGGLNLYAYAGNNPASYTDPFGLCPPSDDNFSDCAPGTSEWYANRLATGQGNAVLNYAGGVLATCGESIECMTSMLPLPPIGGVVGRVGRALEAAGSAAGMVTERIGSRLEGSIAGRLWTAGGRAIRASRGAGEEIGRVAGDHVYRAPQIKGPTHLHAGKLVGNLENKATGANVHMLVQPFMWW